MSAINYYNRELPDWDKNILRYEEGGTEVVRYRMPCISLTTPYTALTWLMYNYMKDIYLADPQGYDEETVSFLGRLLHRGPFWDKVRSTGMYQYESIVNTSSSKRKYQILSNIVSIYRKIETDGFNIAKPIPVTENSRGEIVPLKGAKRIAALLALGVEWVPVVEYDRRTLENVPPEQQETSCIDHAELIFTRMGHMPEVQALKSQYDNLPVFLGEHYNYDKAAELKKLTAARGRFNEYERLLEGNCPLTSTVRDMDIFSPPTAAVVISDEIEIFAWLMTRNLNQILITTDQDLVDQISGIDGVENGAVFFADSVEDARAVIEKTGCSELWAASSVLEKFSQENFTGTKLQRI